MGHPDDTGYARITGYHSSGYSLTGHGLCAAQDSACVHIS